MSDISLNFAWYEILLLIPLVGWPGVVLGGALSAALFWKRRRVLAGLIGAAVGGVVWAVATVLIN
ncbi:MAG: hypothetical protein AB7G40_03785 [Hyphomonadaceae bacterium]